MKKKPEITYYVDTKEIVINRKLGLKPAIITGCLAGIMVGYSVYKSFRYGAGGGIQTMINAYHNGILEALSEE